MSLFKNQTRLAMAYTNKVGDKVYPVVVDIKKGIKSTEDIQFVSSDVNTGILSVAFIQGNDNYNVTGADVVCSVMRPDASTLELPCEVVGENIVEVPLGINGTSQDGVYSFDFKVFKGENKVVGTPIMSYSVSLSIDNDMVVEEDDRLPVLTVLMTQLTELKDEARESINQANTATVASREATANAIEATNNANAVSERVSQETSEAISRVDNKVNEVETRFNALTSSQQQDAEVIDARDGETSLKARLDRDIEKAKQVYVELEGNHISTESSTGAIQDLEILGNTVQDPNNLADIKSVGELQEDGTYKMSILSCGKNLLTLEKMWKAFRDTVDGTNDSSFDGDILSLKWNGIVRKANLTKIKFRENTRYTLSYWCKTVDSGTWQRSMIRFEYTDGTQSNLTSSNTSNTEFTKQTITSLEGKTVKNIVVDLNNTLLINKIQLEEGTQATPYEPYQENKCDILLPCQLEKVGDVSDRLYYDDVEKAWCIEKNVETIILNGSETWLKYRNWDTINTMLFYLDYNAYKVYNKHVAKKEYTECKSNLFNYSPRTDFVNLADKEKIIMYGANTGGDINITTCSPQISILKSKLPTQDVTGFKTWLSQNPTLVKYQLATPQKIVLPLSTQIALNSFFGTTHIYMESGEVEGTIKCKIPKSLGATVQSLNNKTDILSDRIEAIEGLKDSQNMKYETDKGYLVCKETKNGVIDDLKLEGKTLATVLTCSTNKNYAKWTPVDCVSYKAVEVGKVYTIIAQTNNTAQCGLKNRTSNDYLLALAAAEEFICKTITFSKAEELVIVTDTEGTVNMELMILEGDHTQNPSSYFEGLMSVGQDVDKIEVLSRKEDGNLFDINEGFDWTETIRIEDGKVVLSGVTAGTRNVRKLMKLSPNTKYTISIKAEGNQNGTVRGSVDKNASWHNDLFSLSYDVTSKTFTTPNDGIINIGFVCDANKTTKVWDIKIEKGQTVTEYIPHQSDKKQILFYNSNGELEPIQELHEWDSIEKHSDNKWYYHKRSGKVVLNGSENWTNYDSLGACTPYLVEVPKINFNHAPISDKFVGGIFDGRDGEKICVGGSPHIIIQKDNSTLSTQDVEGFKQWLQANPVTVVYQLAQEEVYELAPLHLDSYANETLILCNSGAISPKMEFSITSHINELVKSQGDRISLLEEKMYKALKQVLAGDMYSLAELLYPEDFVEENPENEIMLLQFE